MIQQVFSELGPWNWMVLGFVLLGLEIVVPGVFLLWIGLAALVVGLLSLLLWEASLWVWEAQVLVFLLLSLVSAYIGHRFMGGDLEESDQPLLNRRGEAPILASLMDRHRQLIAEISQTGPTSARSRL